MLAYPGYTVATIRSDLSMRRVRELLECCAIDPPAAMQAAKLNAILCGLLGIKDSHIPEVADTESAERNIKSDLLAMSTGFEVVFEE